MITSYINKFLVVASFMVTPFIAKATVVEIRTSLGVMEVNLFDETTPETVNNFLSYVNAGAYAGSVIHRSVSNFVIQGGGFQYTGPISLSEANEFTLDTVQTSQPVVNEPKLSNVRGTIAMAKIGGDPNSATSQWFINLNDNSGGSASLDATNGGYTVFGQVLGNGMDVADAIAALPVLGGAQNFVFKEIPLKDYTTDDLTNKVDLNDENVIVVSDIVVTDPTVATNTNLTPVINNSANANPPTTDGNTDSGGGGSIFWLALIALFSLPVRRRLSAISSS